MALRREKKFFSPLFTTFIYLCFQPFSFLMIFTTDSNFSKSLMKNINLPYDRSQCEFITLTRKPFLGPLNCLFFGTNSNWHIIKNNWKSLRCFWTKKMVIFILSIKWANAICKNVQRNKWGAKNSFICEWRKTQIKPGNCLCVRPK